MAARQRCFCFSLAANLAAMAAMTILLSGCVIPAQGQFATKTMPDTDPLVDCSLFPTVNTVTSLMSWSTHYHQQITTAGKQWQIKDACDKAIDYRGQAYCKEPKNRDVRQALQETLDLCRAAGIQWQDIQHSTILHTE